MMVRAACLSVFLIGLLPCFAADDAPLVTAHPQWDKVTWETRYDKTEGASLPPNLVSQVPGAMAVPGTIDASFQPATGAKVKFDRDHMYGFYAYVFNDWGELQKLLSAQVPGLTFPLPDPYPNRGLSEAFVLTLEQQKALAGQKGTLTLKIPCEFYQLHLLAKIDLGAPAPVVNGGQTFEVGSLGDTAFLQVWRHGTGDPTDKRAGRSLVFLLVDPVKHTGQILEGTGRGDPLGRRDPTKMDMVYVMDVVPDATPLDQKILYAFDPVVGKTTTEVTVSDPNFEMKWR
jgi:hypothetical protein